MFSSLGWLPLTCWFCLRNTNSYLHLLSFPITEMAQAVEIFRHGVRGLFYHTFYTMAMQPVAALTFLQPPSFGCLFECVCSWTRAITARELQWHHNGHDGVSNHQPHDCLLNRLFRHWSFVRGIHRWPVNSPHKWPVTRKMLPFDVVIMASVCYTYIAWPPSLFLLYLFYTIEILWFLKFSMIMDSICEWLNVICMISIHRFCFCWRGQGYFFPRNLLFTTNHICSLQCAVMTSKGFPHLIDGQLGESIPCPHPLTGTRHTGHAPVAPPQNTGPLSKQNISATVIRFGGKSSHTLIFKSTKFSKKPCIFL